MEAKAGINLEPRAKEIGIGVPSQPSKTQASVQGGLNPISDIENLLSTSTNKRDNSEISQIIA